MAGLARVELQDSRYQPGDDLPWHEVHPACRYALICGLNDTGD